MHQNFKEEINAKNRKKLIHQNTKLFQELTRLRIEIDNFVEKDEQNIVQEPNLDHLKVVIQQQQRQIRHLKQIVEVGRNSNLKQNVAYIMKQQNELVCLKHEMENLSQEKNLINNGHQDKIKRLANNNSLQSHKDQIKHQWNDVKKENRQMNIKIVEMERQIRKFHNLKQMSKNRPSSTINQEAEIANLQSQITKMNIQMKSKQEKWKPNANSLDDTYVQLKGKLNLITKKLEQLQKEQNNMRVRAATLRDLPQIQTDRQLLAKLPKGKKQLLQQKPFLYKNSEKKPQQNQNYYYSTKLIKKNDKNSDMQRYQVPKIERQSVSQRQKLSNKIQYNQNGYINRSINNYKSQIQRINSVDKSKEKQRSISFATDIKNQISKINNSKIEKQILGRSQVKIEKAKAKQTKQNRQSVQLTIQQNKNQNNYFNRKQKQKNKLKQTEADLKIVQTVESSKKLKKSLDKTDRIQSPKKDNLTKKQYQALLSQNKPKINNQKLLHVQTKSKPKQVKQNREVPAKLNERVQIKAKLQETKNNNKKQSKKKQEIIFKQEQIDNKKKDVSKQPKQARQKILSQNLSLKSPQPKLKLQSPKSKQKVQIINQNAVSRQKSNKKLKQQAYIKQQKIIQIQKEKNEPKPIFEIAMKDIKKKNSAVKQPQALLSLLSNNMAEQQNTDGIPKLIKRRKNNKNQYVTMGTST